MNDEYGGDGAESEVNHAPRANPVRRTTAFWRSPVLKDRNDAIRAQTVLSNEDVKFKTEQMQARYGPIPKE